MSKNSFIKRLITIFIIAVFVLSFSTVSFAARSAKLTMITGNMTVTISKTEIVDINVIADYSSGSGAIVWSTGTDYLTYSSRVDSGTKSTATYTLSPTENSTSKSFTIYAQAGGITKSISVSVVLNDAPSEPDPNELTYTKYVALGDSIATGTYYTGIYKKMLNDSYVKYFSDYLKTKYSTVDTVNLSHDGDQTTQLLSLLNTTSVITQVQTADIITVTIGANNLMQAAKTLLGTYNFSKIDWNKAEAGRALFEKDWPIIVARIKAINPDARLMVMTIYNPYNSNESNYLKITEKFTNTINNGINDIINAQKGTDYEVVDVYSAFKEEALKNNMKTFTYFYESLRDPHPKPAGHQWIGALHQAVFEALQ